MLRNYDPQKIVCSFRGTDLLGMMDGTFLVAERNEDGFTTAVGATGDVTRVRNRNRTGTITVTIKAESPTNDLLSSFAQIDELFGTGTGVLQVIDLNGTTLVLAESAWIRKLPNTEYSVDASGREWVFECAELDMFVGGAVL